MELKSNIRMNPTIVSTILKFHWHMDLLRSFLLESNNRLNLNKSTQMSLPRMSFEFTDLQYDPTRKSTQTQQFVVKNSTGSEIKKGYVPVPYNMTIQLSVMTKLNDDMLRLLNRFYHTSNQRIISQSISLVTLRKRETYPFNLRVSQWRMIMRVTLKREELLYIL